ncbi:MAG: Holliday junction branch migration protein RuvA [Thiomargarita sp.]|nr:Holliday junction branch migration protein RuvA [Thiomargarita sp.]
MISRLQGILIEKQPPLLVIDVHGVGYEVFAPMSTFYTLSDINTEVTLLMHLTVRADAHILYGFISEAERCLFRDLIRVTKLGPKLALSILSSMELATFVQCIHENNTTRLIRIPGVGKKMAERLVIEMRDRLKNWHNPAITDSPQTDALQNLVSPVEDAISALVALGYKPNDAHRWVHAIYEEGLSSDTLIRRALNSAL